MLARVSVAIFLTVLASTAQVVGLPTLTIGGDSVLPGGHVGKDYPGLPLTVSGAIGFAPRFIWDCGDSLAAGLSMNPANGRIVGTPTAPGLSVIWVTVRQVVKEGESDLTVAEGRRRFALMVQGAAAYPANPATLRFSFGPERLLLQRSTVVSGIRGGEVPHATSGYTYGELPAGRPELSSLVWAASTLTSPGTSTSTARLDVTASLVRQRISDNDGGPWPEAFGEIIIYSAPPPVPGPRRVPGRAASVESPDLRILTVFTYTEPPPFAVTKEVTFRFNRNRPDTQPADQVLAVVTPNFNSLGFSPRVRVVTPSRGPTDWLRIVRTDTSAPGTVTVGVRNLLQLPAGVYLGVVEYSLSQARAKVDRREAVGEAVTRTAVILKVGDDNTFDMLPEELQIDNPNTDKIDLRTKSPQQSVATDLEVEAIVVDGADGWLTAERKQIKLGETVTANLSREALGPGIYTGYVAVSDPAANINDGKAAKVKVVLSVDADGSVTVETPPVDSQLNGEPRTPGGESSSHEIESEGTGTPPSGKDRPRSASVEGYPFKIKTFSVGNWLSFTVDGAAMTPASGRVSADSRDLDAKGYAGAVVVLTEGTTNPTHVLPVSLNVKTPATGPVQQNAARVLPLYLDGDGWQTTMVVFNPNPTRVSATLQVWDKTSRNGQRTPLEVNLLGGGTVRRTSRVPFTLEPLGHETIQSANTPFASLVEGWAEVAVVEPPAAPLVGYAIFRRNRTGGAPPLEMATSLGDFAPSGSVVPFDNTAGSKTFVAMLSPGPQTVGFQLIARNVGGEVIARCQFSPTVFGRVPQTDLPALVQATSGRKGTLEMVALGTAGNNSCRERDLDKADPVVPGGGIGLLAYRQGSEGALSSLPFLVLGQQNGTSRRRTVPFIAHGNGWETEIVLANLDYDSSPALVDFLRQDGSALRVLSGGVLRSSIGDSVRPAGVFNSVTTLTGAEALGWADLSASPAFSGVAFLRKRRAGGEIGETSIPAGIAPKARWWGHFDDAGSGGTRLVLKNPGLRDILVNVTVRNGADRRTFPLPLGRSRQEIVNLAQRFGMAAGSIEVSATSGEVTAVLLRYDTRGDLSTTVPMF